MFSAGHEELMSSWKDSAFLDMKRYKDWDHEISSSNYLNTCSVRFPGAQSVSLHPDIPSGGVEGQ